MAEARAPAPGFHGKVPDRGDFLSRRIPAAFLPVWDDWLAMLVAASRDALGPDWLAAWQRMPIWHAAFGPGVLGAADGLGVLIPSVDRVGRHFPFTILAASAPRGVPARAWSIAAERLALAALDEGFDPAALDAELVALGAPEPVASDVTAADAPGWPPQVGAALAGLRVSETLWWCADEAGPLLIRADGLPTAAQAAGIVLGTVS